VTDTEIPQVEAQGAAYGRASRLAQGLPAQVEDPTFYAELAAHGCGTGPLPVRDRGMYAPVAVGCVVIVLAALVSSAIGVKVEADTAARRPVVADTTSARPALVAHAEPGR